MKEEKDFAILQSPFLLKVLIKGYYRQGNSGIFSGKK